LRSVTLQHAGRAALAAAALWASASAAASAPGFSLESSARQLIAGHETAAILTVHGSPEQLRDVRISCTPGAVRNVRKAGPQQVRADYVMPRSPAASWVLCAALGSGGATAVTGLEIQRREMLPITNLPALSRVLVKMGDTVYGPVRANAVGYAEVQVTLSPAFPHAEVQATPPGKPTETRPYPLSVLSSEQLLLLTGDAQVVADGSHSVDVYAFTLGERGEPQDLPVFFAASEGAVAMRRTGTGLWAGRYTPAPRLSPGEAVLSARVPNARPVSAPVTLLKGLTPKLALEAPQEELLADGQSSVELLVRVADNLGQALAGQAPRLTAQRGRVGPVLERAPGVYVAQYTVPSDATGPVQLIAELPGAEPATAAVRLRSLPRLSVTLDRDTLPADGQSHALLSVIARDAFGRALPEGAPLSVTTTLGAVPREVHTSQGRAAIPLTASKEAGEATVVVRVGDESRTVSVRMLPGAPAEVSISPEHPSVLCDGRDGTDLRLFVKDAYGNGLDGVPIQLAMVGPQERRLGRLDRVAALGKGEFIARYHAPLDCPPGPLALEAVAGELHAHRELKLFRSFPHLVGVTVRGGAQHNLSNLPWLLLQAEAESNTGVLEERLLATVGVQLAYGNFTFGGNYGGSGTFNSQVRMVMGVLSLGPRFTAFEKGKVTGYVGAGLDGYLAHITESLQLGGVTSGPEYLVPAPFVGVHVRAGLTYALGQGALTLEARYAAASLNEEKLLLHIEQLAGLSGTVGYRMAF